MARPKQNPQQTTVVTPKKKLTLNEFRAWLSGVEEMQDDSWTPTATQWRTIRAKIEEVIDVPVQQPRRTISEDGYDERPMMPPRMSGPSAFAAPPTAAPPPTALIVEPSGVAAPGVASTGTKMKTPNIDTSTKPYVAAFE